MADDMKAKSTVISIDFLVTFIYKSTIRIQDPL